MDFTAQAEQRPRSGSSDAPGVGSSSTASSTATLGKRKRGESCDTCRRRKTRCVPTKLSSRCEQCESQDIDCTYLYQPKKPGPQNTHTDGAEGGKSARSANSSSRRSMAGRRNTHSGDPLITVNADVSPSVGSREAEMYHPSGESIFASSPERSSPVSVAPSYGLRSSEGISQSPIAAPWGPFPAPESSDLTTAFAMSVNESASSSPAGRISPTLHASAGSSRFHGALSGLEPITFTSPSPLSLEHVAPRQTFLDAISVYMTHLYPLLPFVHRPSFSQAIIEKRDERDPVFLAFVLSLVAYTVVQCPLASVFDGWTDLRKLANRFHLASRSLQGRLYTPLTLTHLATLYCDHIYLGSIGCKEASHAVIGEVCRLAFSLGIHDDARATGMDAIECELRRRLYWILYGSDKTIAILEGVPAFIRDSDSNVSFPADTDDDLLTRAGPVALQMPDHTPILAGFVHVSRLHRLMSDIIVSHHRIVPSYPSATNDGVAELASVHAYFDRVRQMLETLPNDLQFNREPTNIAIQSVYAIQRANILITHALILFTLHGYKEQALSLISGERHEVFEEHKQDACNLLEHLKNMSIDSISANGESMRQKVLYIANSLLNRLPPSSAGYAYVLEFLALHAKLSEGLEK